MTRAAAGRGQLSRPVRIIFLMDNLGQFGTFGPGLNRPAPEVVYIPFGQVPDGMTQLGNRIVPASWIIRTSGDPRGLIPSIQREFLAVDAMQRQAIERACEILPLTL